MKDYTLEELSIQNLLQEEGIVKAIHDQKSGLYQYSQIECFAVGVVYNKFDDPKLSVELFTLMLCKMGACPGIGSWPVIMDCLVVFTCFINNSFNNLKLNGIASELDVNLYQNPDNSIDMDAENYSSLEIQYQLAVCAVLAGADLSHINKDILNHVHAKLSEIVDEILN